MVDKLITIVTATYNRSKLLHNLFVSLTNQESYNFVWMIIDDGSIDDTEEASSQFKNDKFDVIYYKKANGGKHTAINYALERIETPLLFIVDSDDTLLREATKYIEEYYNKYKNELYRLCAFSFLRCYQDGKPVIGIERGEFIKNYIDYRIRKERPGDMAEVFITEALKKYRFPEYNGEKFISEDVLWIEVSKKLDYVFINKCIYKCEYLENGLTDSDKLLKFASPLGSMKRGKQLMYKRCGFKQNIKGSIIFNCYSLETNKNDVKADTFYEKMLVTLTKPIGYYFNYKWKKSLVGKKQ